jgi:hypothetical protein
MSLIIEKTDKEKKSYLLITYLSTRPFKTIKT